MASSGTAGLPIKFDEKDFLRTFQDASLNPSEETNFSSQSFSVYVPSSLEEIIKGTHLIFYHGNVMCPEYECQSIYLNSKGLMLHLLRHRGFDYRCRICKTFIHTKDKLKHHKLKEHKTLDLDIDPHEEKMTELIAPMLTRRSDLVDGGYKPAVFSDQTLDELYPDGSIHEALPSGEDPISKSLREGPELSEGELTFYMGCASKNRITVPQTVEGLQRILETCIKGKNISYLKETDCPYGCDKGFLSCQEILKHITRHLKLPHFCRICYKPFKKRRDLESHVKNNHPLCYTCGLRLLTNEELSAHKKYTVYAQKYMAVIATRIKTVVDCFRSNVPIWAFHMSNLKEFKSFNLVDHPCSHEVWILSKDNAEVIDTLELQHIMATCFENSIVVFKTSRKCRHCDKMFDHCRDLVVHGIQVHGGISKICSTCYRPCKDYKEILEHRSATHIICPLDACKEAFATPSAYEKHTFLTDHHCTGLDSSLS